MREGRKKADSKSENTKRRKQAKENADLSKGVDIANKAVEKEKEQKEVKEKTNSKKSKILKYVLVICVILLLVGLFKYRHILGITFMKEISEDDAIVIETTTSENKVYAYQNELLVYSKGKLATYSKYGKKTWEYTFEETFIPDITTNGKYIQVVNKNNGYIYVFENKYESCRKKIDGTIKRASINEKGQSIIHYSKEGNKSNIGIYSKKGEEEYSITLTTENVAKVDISPNGRYALIYEVETKGISPNSLIKIVDLNNDDKVTTSLEVENDAIYDIKLTNLELMAISSDTVYKYNIKTGDKKEFKTDDKNIVNISIDKSGISYVCKEISDESNMAVVMLNNKYEEIGRHKLEENAKYFTYYNSLAVVTYNKEINIYNRWGMYIKKFNANSIITNPIIFNNGKNIAINYSNKIIVIGI